MAAPAQVVLVGRVTGPDGQPIGNAEVAIDSLRARTTETGRFVLHPREARAVEVTVRAVGFQPSTARVNLVANDTATVDFILSRIVQTLDSVNVEAPSAVVSAKMVAFEDRRRSGFGRFYTREALAKQEHSTVANVLRTSNVKLLMRPNSCGGGYSVATGRGGSTSMSSPPCNSRTFMPPGCYAPIYLDGVAIWGPGWGPPPDVNQFKVTDLEAIEVYRSAAEVPLQFQMFRSPCGVVLFWTRTGRT